MEPFLHEFTYQAMANNLLPIEDGTKYSFVLSWNSNASQWFVYRYKFHMKTKKVLLFHWQILKPSGSSVYAS